MKNNIKVILSFFFGVMMTLLSVSFFFKIQENQFQKEYINLDISKIIQNFSSKISISDNSRYNRFEEIYDVLKKEYWSWDLVNSGDMLDFAMKSFVDSIWDPFTSYMDVKQNKELMETLQGSSDFEWIWAYISKKNNWIRIEEVINNSPSYKAWLMTFDTIVQVDGKSILDMSLEQWIKLIKWPAWTKVTLTIIRKNKSWEWELKKFDVIRDKVKIFSVKWEMFSWWIWYLKISSVWEETADLFEKEAKYLKDQWMQKLILDLRWNWGWILDVAVDILSNFVPKWEIVVSAKYRKYPNKDYKSKGYWLLQWMPLVVLVDSMTASAWEIIAMALVELSNAKLVWTQTFGKWTIQIVHPFADQSSLKYTIWKRYSPDWNNIHGTWYFTWEELSFDRSWYINNDIDNQLESAKKYFLSE